jgi:hypothetical protein
LAILSLKDGGIPHHRSCSMLLYFSGTEIEDDETVDVSPNEVKASLFTYVVSICMLIILLSHIFRSAFYPAFFSFDWISLTLRLS